MLFPMVVALPDGFTLADLERAETHLLDAVLTPVSEGNKRKVMTAMDAVRENGWAVRFIVRLPKRPSRHWRDIAMHPMALGFAVAGNGGSVTWTTPQSDRKHRCVWVKVQRADDIFSQVMQGLLEDFDGVCFERLPSDGEASERERLKAIASAATRWRLWQPLLSERTEVSDAEAENAYCRCWRLIKDEWLLSVFPSSPLHPVTLSFPFAVPEGVRAYGLSFPAIKRFPLQHKGDKAIVKLGSLAEPEVVWLTSDGQRLERMHHRAGELLTKAMQFAVQWALARKEQMGDLPTDLKALIWQMLQAAKRRQFSKGYLLAHRILERMEIAS